MSPVASARSKTPLSTLFNAAKQTEALYAETLVMYRDFRRVCYFGLHIGAPPSAAQITLRFAELLSGLSSKRLQDVDASYSCHVPWSKSVCQDEVSRSDSLDGAAQKREHWPITSCAHFLNGRQGSPCDYSAHHWS